MMDGMVWLANEDMAMWMLRLAQARLVASSPSGWAMAWRPAGDTQRGKEIFFPRAVQLVLVFETFLRTRHQRRYFGYAVRFSWTVI